MDESIAKSQIITEALNIYARGITIFNIQNPMTLNFDFSLRGRLAGTAIRNNVQYNLDTAMKNFDTFMIDTVPHEISHVICDQAYPRSKSHGREWKYIMVKLGYEPNRCHDMQYTPSRMVKKYDVFCNCDKPLQVGIKVYNRIKDGNKYKCTVCKGRIRCQKS
jgi:SprT protein